MVNKEVEKRSAELRSEFFLMSLDLFEMVDENHAQWLEAMVQVLRESSLHHITVDRDWKTSNWLRQMEEGNCEEEDAEPLNQGTKCVLLKKMVLRTFSDVFTDGDSSESETSDVSPGGDSKTSSSETSDSSPNSETSDSKTSSCETSDDSPNSNTSGSKTCSSETIDGSPNSDASDSKTCGSENSSSETIDCSPNSNTSDGKTSGSETSDVSPGCDTSSQPAESDQQENQTGTSQLMRKEEEKISKNPFRQNPGSMTSEGEGERVLMNGTNEEEALLMEREWKEWMDEQEMRGNVKTFGHQNAEERGGAAPPTPEKATKNKNVRGVGTVKKIKSYLGDLFHPPMYHKWERFEDED